MDSIETLKTAIGFDTVTTRSNLGMIEWARDLCARHGASILLDYDKTGGKANLFATFGDGPGGLVLSGHTDVVSVEGQNWTSDPFKAEIREGRIYGRGACDMKGFVAVILSRIPYYNSLALKQPVHLALTYDEEQGCLGIPKLIEALSKAHIKPAACLVGEPTMMNIVAAHKGGRVYRCKVTGKAAHSSLTPTAVNAIEYGARVIARIQEIGTRERQAGIRANGFDVPFTTISTNLFNGGDGPNIVPALADFLFDYRYVPGFDPQTVIDELEAFVRDELLPGMKAVDPNADIQFSLVNAIPALEAGESELLVQAALPLAASRNIEKVAYGTEASFFQSYGVSSIVCGPGSIEQAHKADEFVSLDQIRACDAFVEALVAKLAA